MAAPEVRRALIENNLPGSLQGLVVLAAPLFYDYQTTPATMAGELNVIRPECVAAKGAFIAPPSLFYSDCRHL